MNFVGNTKLLISRGMTGATGNYYAGLHEFEDMSFLLHFLREEDLFVDVGANVGSYTVLAAGHCGAKVITIEPVPETYRKLQDNIIINRLGDLVSTFNVAIGSQEGDVWFTTGLDTVNHVLPDDGRNSQGVQVKMQTLDEIIGDRQPALLKIDVEGFELEVLRGGTKVLAQPSVKALIMEDNGSEDKYGFDNDDLKRILKRHQFLPFHYLPFERKLLTGPPVNKGNCIYVRDHNFVQSRLISATTVSIRGTSF